MRRALPPTALVPAPRQLSIPFDPWPLGDRPDGRAKAIARLAQPPDGGRRRRGGARR